MQEEAKAKEEEGIPDEEGWVKVTRRGRRPVLPRTEAASLRVLERERRKRARKELLNFYAWQHREAKMERKQRPRPLPFSPASLGARPGPWPLLPAAAGTQMWRAARPGCGVGVSLGTDFLIGSGVGGPSLQHPPWRSPRGSPAAAVGALGLLRGCRALSSWCRNLSASSKGPRGRGWISSAHRVQRGPLLDVIWGRGGGSRVSTVRVGERER